MWLPMSAYKWCALGCAIVPMLSGCMVVAENDRYELTADTTHPSMAVKLHGARWYADGAQGRALELPRQAHAEVAAPSFVSTRAGTISFWVKPSWPPIPQRSHTFVSLPWAGSSYLALSHGWWEPQGSNRLYFIVSNAELMHCSVPYAFALNQWVLITATWSSGPEGYCRLFINGEKRAEHRQAFAAVRRADGPLYLGSDHGASNRRGRDAQAVLYKFTLWGHALTEREVLEWYRRYALAKDDSLHRTEAANVADPVVVHDQRGNVVESRVIFDEDMHWALSPAAADAILARVKAAGFNVYVPCIWHGNGTFYPSSLVRPDPKLTEALRAGHDPLAYLIERAHRLGIEVHPWFTVIRRENQWFPQYYDEGAPVNAYDVHNEAFRRFIVELMLDVVRRYDVDGINLDYIRSMGTCDSERCRADYRRRYRRSLQADLYIQKLSGSAPRSLVDWNRQAVADIVRNVSVRAKAIKPDLIVSADVHMLNEALLAEGQDAAYWANSGWVDVVYQMDYRRNVDFDEAQRARALLAEPTKMVLLLSTYDRIDSDIVARDAQAVVERVRQIRRLWPATGVGFYHYVQLADSQAAALGANVFSGPAVPAWRTAPDAQRR